MVGVVDVVVGYTGGKEEWPSYRSMKDHTEAVRVTFDSRVVTYAEIVKEYFNQNSSIHYPSYSRQYRSAIMVHNEEQRQIAEELIQNKKLQENREVFVDIENATTFYRAEEYHQKWEEKQRRGTRN